ncbi:Uncharacterized protein APZ42_002547, partial [Daphnia magna]
SEQEQRAAVEAQSQHDNMRGKMREKCQNMSRLIENAVVNVGRIITDLRPSILDHQGLWDALAWQAQEFVQSAEQELKWCMDVNVQRVLPEPMAMAVFRIFQEMLSNVGRHARARTVDVDIVERQGWLHLSVEDDGCGAEAQVLIGAGLRHHGHARAGAPLWRRDRHRQPTWPGHPHAAVHALAFAHRGVRAMNASVRVL